MFVKSMKILKIYPIQFQEIGTFVLVALTGV